MAKGAVAVLLGAHYGPDTAVLAGGGAVIGHIAPIWLGFKGGKGVATALGVLTALAWPVGILSAVTWLIVAAVGRISSLAALIAIGAAPVYAYLLVDPQRAELALFIAVLVWLRHYENIRRLLNGQEPRIGGLKG
jgi:glycerol-3-phosphate acyltransferase PlsY